MANLDFIIADAKSFKTLVAELKEKKHSTYTALHGGRDYYKLRVDSNGKVIFQTDDLPYYDKVVDGTPIANPFYETYSTPAPTNSETAKPVAVDTTDYKAKSSALEAKCAELEASLRACYADLARETEYIDKLKSELTDKENELVVATDKIDEQNEALDQCAIDISEQAASIETLKDELIDKQESINKLDESGTLLYGFYDIIAELKNSKSADELFGRFHEIFKFEQSNNGEFALSVTFNKSDNIDKIE